MVRAQRSVRHFCIYASVLILSLTVFIVPTRAIDENLTKGATNNHVFEAGMWGENIDLLNGGLNLTVPIGPSYRVSPDVSYQLKLTYSSKIWHLEEGGTYWSGTMHHRARARLSGRGQAGLGFMLQFGRYLRYANSAECWDGSPASSKGEELVFEDATGATHGVLPGEWRGAGDGSYLEITESHVAMPDGTQYLLNHQVEDLISNQDQRWSHCGVSVPPSGFDTGGGPATAYDFYTNEYRGNYVTRIEGKDRASNGRPHNFVILEYETAPGMKHLIKRICDSRDPNTIDGSGNILTTCDPSGPTTVVFTNSNQDPSDPNNPNATLEMGYVKSVTFPAFRTDPGTPESATYTFNYTLSDVGDPHVNPNDPNALYRAADNLNDTFEDVLLLTGIQFPEGYSMSFEYDGAEWIAPTVGYLQARVLPTGARIEYTYHQYRFQPEVCTTTPTAPCPPHGSCPYPSGGGFCYVSSGGLTQGIGSKTIIPDPLVPTTFYTWTYEREPHAVGRPNPGAVVTTDPFGNDTVTYYHADNMDTKSFPDPQDPNYAVYHSDIWRNGRLYRTEYYRGTWTNPANLVRTEEQVWEDDVENPSDEDNYRHTSRYPRVIDSKVTYHDDGTKTVRTSNEDWDGLGNFRKITEYGFDGVPYRIQRTDYNCDNRDSNGECIKLRPDTPGGDDCTTPYDPSTCPLSLAHLSNRIFGTYSLSQSEYPNGSVLQRSEFSFDDLGYLRSRQDLLTIPSTITFQQPGDPGSGGSAGDVVTQFLYEGDGGCPAGSSSAPTGNVCEKTVREFGSPTSTLTERYTYASGSYLKTRQIVGVPWLADDRDIDTATGLTRVSRDAAGIATTFDYDSLGRLTQV